MKLKKCIFKDSEKNKETKKLKGNKKAQRNGETKSWTKRKIQMPNKKN